MGNKLRAVVIGCGRIGSEFDDDPKRKYVSTHAGAYSSVSGCTLVAACDSDKTKLDKCMKRWSVPAGYGDYKAMMAKESADIVSVCTPPGTHYPIIKDLVKYKGLKAIFCEKPIADTLDNARKMVKLCDSRGVILQVDHQRRFDPLHRKLKEFISGKKMGEAQQANFYYIGGIKNTGSHMFDILRFFFGDAEWVEGFLSRNVSGKKDDPNLDGIIKFKNGLLVTFQACDGKNYLIFESNILFEKGRVALKNNGFDVDFYQTGESRYFSGYNELQKKDTPFDTAYKRDFMVEGVEHLLDCVERNKKSLSSGQDGLNALELIEKSIESASSNGCRKYLK